MALCAAFTGRLLPWDQIALRAVTVGTNISGYRPLFGHQVRFVLIGGAEIARQTLISWLLIHIFVAGALLTALVVVALWPARPRRQAATATASR